VGRIVAAAFSILLLLVAMYLFGFAFQVSSGQAFIFFGGILLMAISFALPIHVFSRR
jgi:cytochrome b561